MRVWDSVRRSLALLHPAPRAQDPTPRTQGLPKHAAAARAHLPAITKRCTEVATSALPRRTLGVVGASRVPPLPDTDFHPLSDLQSGMIGHALRSSGNSVYFQQFILKLHARFLGGSRAMAKGMGGKWCGGTMLRTRIHIDDRGHLFQSFAPEVTLEFEHRDLRDLPPSEQIERIEEFLEGDRRRGFEFASDCLSRWQHFTLGEQTCWLVWSSHHAILDGRFPRLELLKEVGADATRRWVDRSRR